MDMQTPPQDAAKDPAALLKQAQDLIGQALAAMGAEEAGEQGQPGGGMDSTRADIAKQVFGG